MTRHDLQSLTRKIIAGSICIGVLLLLSPPRAGADEANPGGYKGRSIWKIEFLEKGDIFGVDYKEVISKQWAMGWSINSFPYAPPRAMAFAMTADCNFTPFSRIGLIAGGALVILTDRSVERSPGVYIKLGLDFLYAEDHTFGVEGGIYAGLPHLLGIYPSDYIIGWGGCHFKFFGPA